MRAAPAGSHRLAVEPGEGARRGRQRCGASPPGCRRGVGLHRDGDPPDERIPPRAPACGPGGLGACPKERPRPAQGGRSSSPTSGRSLLEGAQWRAGRTRRAAGTAVSLTAARQPGVLSSVTSTVSRPFLGGPAAPQGAAHGWGTPAGTEQTTSEGATSVRRGALDSVILPTAYRPKEGGPGVAHPSLTEGWRLTFPTGWARRYSKTSRTTGAAASAP